MLVKSLTTEYATRYHRVRDTLYFSQSATKLVVRKRVGLKLKSYKTL